MYNIHKGGAAKAAGDAEANAFAKDKLAANYEKTSENIKRVRFFSQSVNADANGDLNAYNLYAYCSNNPVMYSDASGHIAISTIFAIVAAVVIVAAAANDIYQIATENVILNEEETTDENVHIDNSYKLLTPFMRYGYSFYLNHFKNETKDIIQGSTIGMEIEWALHNIAAWTGIGGDSAKHLDVGASIFSDGEVHPLIDNNGNISGTGAMSFAMRWGYLAFGHPVAKIWDLIVSGGC